MATRRSSSESTSDLYIRLGLSLDELESGFVDAQRTIRDNMSRLWRENTIIDLQMQVDLTGLDPVEDAARILTIRTKALNEQLKNQRDRVRLASAELRNMEERTGANSDQTQRARIALEHHRLELARLEEQLRSLNETQSTDLGGLDSLTEAFDNFARQCWNVIGISEIVGDAISELVEHFRELQTQAYELNMPVNDVENFLRQMRLAGGDIGDFEGYIRGITDAFVKGEWDDPEFLALDKYGAKITDATGRLKNFQAITEEVYQAYRKAKEAGEEIEFLQLTGGESGVRDAIQYFERYEEAKEDAEKIFDAGLDPEELHEADRALKLLTEQLGEFKDAAVNIIVPRAIRAMQYFFELIRGGTEFLVEHKDVLRDFTKPILGVVELGKQAFKIRQMILGNTDDLQDYNDGIQTAAASWGKFRKAESLVDNNPLSQYAIKRIKDFRDELADLRIDIEFDDNEYQKALAKLELWKKNELTDKLYVSSDERLAIEELYTAKLEKIELDRANKLEEIRNKEEADIASALEKRFAAIDKAQDKWREAGMDEPEIAELSEKLKTDARVKLEEEFQAAINSIGEDSLKKALARIEKEKRAWIQKGIEEVRATEWAEQAKLATVTKLEGEFQAAMDGISGDSLGKAMARIEKEKNAWIQKGIDESRATEWADQTKLAAVTEEYQKLQDKQDQYNKRRRDYYAKQEEEYQKELEKRRQAAEELYYKLAALRQDDLTNALDAIEKERQAWIEKGIAASSANEWAQQAAVNTQRDSALKVLKEQMKELQIFQREGYEGLKKHYQTQLMKDTGVSKFFLDTLNPQLIETFKQASQVAQNSLLPFFMTRYDRAAESQVSRGGRLESIQSPIKYNEPSMNDSKPPEPPQDLDRDFAKLFALIDDMGLSFEDILNQLDQVELPVFKLNDQLEQVNIPVFKLNEQLSQVDIPVDKFNEQLSLINIPIDKLNEQLDNLQMAKDDEVIVSLFGDLIEIIAQSLIPCFNDFAQYIAATTVAFEDLTQGMQNFHQELIYLVDYLASLPFGGGGGARGQVNGSEASFSPTGTNNVTNNITINEAHAWDNAHIQALSEKVADVLLPELNRALGGARGAY